MLYQHLAALALAATTLVAAGCGSSKSESTTTVASTPITSTSTSAPNTTTTQTTASKPVLPAATVIVASGKPLTTVKWISKGDAICAQLHHELKTLNIKTTAELPRVLPQAAAYERTEVKELSKLVPPASKNSDWQEFLNESLQWAEGSAKLAEEAKLGDAITTSPVATATTAVQEHLVIIARRDGFSSCARY